MRLGGNRRVRVFRIVERVLFGIAGIALGWYAAVNMAAVREQDALSSELDRARASVQSVSSAKTSPAPHAVVGRIELPRLRLKAVAREGVDTRTLRGAVGHVPGTALPGETGNAAFAAHRDTFFRALKGVRVGDEVTITAPDGVYRYVVTGTRIVEPSDISVLDPSAGKTLTLVTCYPFDYVGSAPKRFIVSGRLTSAPGPTASGL